MWKTRYTCLNRMRRLLSCLAPWMAVATAWAQAQTALTVDYTFHGTFVDQGALADGVRYVTPGLLRRFGWTVDSNNGTLNVLAEGRPFDLEPKLFNGTKLYSLDEALRYVGAAAEWDEKTKTMTVLSQIRNVEKTEKGFRIDGTLAVRTRSFRSSSPDKLVVDLNGAKLEPKFVSQLPSNWRISQYDPKTVRFVIESPAMAQQPVPDMLEARFVEVELNAVVAKPVQAVVTVGPPQKGPDNKDGVTVVIPITGQLANQPSAVFLDPNTVQVTIPGSSAQSTGPKEIADSKWVDAIGVDDDSLGTATVTVKLDRPLAFQLSSNSAGIMLAFTKPHGTGGLAGKVIVVDAGHGGKDSGATEHGVMEKNQTLPMAKTISKALGEAGASVILSRSDDTFVSLSERPAIANRSHADLFISCHFNSNSVDDSRSGIIVFHHKGTPMGMLLAECISHEIAKEKQLPDMGVWSDGRIYQSGFAVLRGSTMPAVLMELGFLNHSQDRSKIQSQEYRDAIARAVVRGVKEFFGEEKKD